VRLNHFERDRNRYECAGVTEAVIVELAIEPFRISDVVALLMLIEAVASLAGRTVSL